MISLERREDATGRWANGGTASSSFTMSHCRIRSTRATSGAGRSEYCNGSPANSPSVNNPCSRDRYFDIIDRAISNRYDPIKHKSKRLRIISELYALLAEDVENGWHLDKINGISTDTVIRSKFSKRNINRLNSAAKILELTARDIRASIQTAVPAVMAQLSIKGIYKALDKLCDVLGESSVTSIDPDTINRLDHMTRTEIYKAFKQLLVLLPKPKVKRKYRRLDGFDDRVVADFLWKIGYIKSHGTNAIRQYHRLTGSRKLTHPADNKSAFFHDIITWARTNNMEEAIRAAIINTWPDAEQYTR